ncbi:MAG: nucleotidyltransferase domain-containing protein [Euryarchaeota archaeon]|nr:nucleotidyltransferase domain-containing protein [Euryarchaeota archaeon]
MVVEFVEKSKKVLNKVGADLGIDYAIIFGSAIRGKLNQESDVDIGIKFKQLPTSSKILLDKIIKIKEILEDELKRSVDIVILNKANEGLLYEIFSTGVKIFASDEEKFVEEKTGIIKKYLDFKYYIQRHWEEKVERLLHGK